MTKIFIHSILIIIMLYTQLYYSCVTAVYEINFDYYANELCENREVPEMHCDGKCYFSKQLNLADDSPKETERPPMLPALRLFTPPSFNFSIAPAIVHSLAFDGNNREGFLRAPFIARIEHPPQV